MPLHKKFGVSIFRHASVWIARFNRNLQVFLDRDVRSRGRGQTLVNNTSADQTTAILSSKIENGKYIDKI